MGLEDKPPHKVYAYGKAKERGIDIAANHGGAKPCLPTLTEKA
jgi:hypothetical protein